MVHDKNSVNVSKEHSGGDALLSPVSPEQGLAGRELDAAIAEYVMRFTRAPEPPHPTDNRAINGVLYYLPDTPWDRNQHNVVPYFSADINAALDVVNHLMSQGWQVDMTGEDESPHWWVCFDNTINGRLAIGEEGADTLPEAICRAALRAVAHSAPAR